MGPIITRVLVVIALVLLHALSAVAAAEYVLVQKVIDDQAIIIRLNGAVYLIDKGIGCLSLWRYEGRRVIIDSPGIFSWYRLTTRDSERRSRMSDLELDADRHSCVYTLSTVCFVESARERRVFFL